MMLQSISKIKIYFYLFLFVLLSTFLNLNFITKFEKSTLITEINISGLNTEEKNLLIKNLKVFINKNIFSINKNEVEKKLKINTFLESYRVKKVFPSKLFINVKKTEFLGKTIIDFQEFYIGKNGRFTKSSFVEDEYNLPHVFGDFKINDFLKLQKILVNNGINLNNFDKYYYFKSNRWDIENKNNVILKLPSVNIENSLNIYKSLISSKNIESVKLIDLRIPNKVITTNE